MDARTNENAAVNSQLVLTTQVKLFNTGTRVSDPIPELQGNVYSKYRERTQLYEAKSVDVSNFLLARAMKAAITGAPPAFNCVDSVNAAVDAMSVAPPRVTRSMTPLPADAVTTFQGLFNANANNV